MPPTLKLRVEEVSDQASAAQVSAQAIVNAINSYKKEAQHPIGSSPYWVRRVVEAAQDLSQAYLKYLPPGHSQAPSTSQSPLTPISNSTRNIVSSASLRSQSDSMDDDGNLFFTDADDTITSEPAHKRRRLDSDGRASTQLVYPSPDERRLEATVDDDAPTPEEPPRLPPDSGPGPGFTRVKYVDIYKRGSGNLGDL